MMPGLVECYSGSSYAERPVAFQWQGERFAVRELIDRKRTPEGLSFRVCIEEGQVFDLVFLEETGEWFIQQVA